jgi:hypothetical protein
MYRTHHAPAPRKGIILLVVLALLTLFTIIGISFVLYADAAATQAKTAKDSNNLFQPDMEPEDCLSYFLNQFLFDVRDDESGVYSSLRGHSLMRSMYGFNYDYADVIFGSPATALSAALTNVATATAVTVQSAAGFPAAPSFNIQVDNEVMTVTAMAGTTWTVTRAANGTALAAHLQNANVFLVVTPDSVVQNGNNVAFSGTGRLHYQGPNNLKDAGGNVVDDYQLVNYMYYSGDGFLRDPERYGWRNGLRTPGKDNRGPYAGAFNVSYTYPDLNNFFLGAIDSNGDLLMPSFHREWLFGRLDSYPGNPNGVAVNPNWTNAVGKYLLPRPRPQENPGFPYPGDRWGDVKNLQGYPGGNDSIWMDIGAPVLTGPDGRKYKMLVAPLVLELDGRLQLNAHGNIMGQQGTQVVHASNMGLGPWEVNLGMNALAGAGVLSATDPNTNAPEWLNLFFGRTNPEIIGRYGPKNVPVASLVQSATPLSTNLATSIRQPREYAQWDYSGKGRGTRVRQPDTTLNYRNHLSTNPTFPAGYNNDNHVANAASIYTALEDRQNHAMRYNIINPFAAQLDTTQNPVVESPYWNKRFPTSNMERLARWNDTSFESLTSELERLLPMNFNDPNDVPGSFRRRNMVTTLAGDRNVPGVTPYIWDPAAAPYLVGPAAAQWDKPPVGTAPVFPTPTIPATQPPVGSEFTADWRSKIAATLGRLDLVNPTLPNLTTPTAAPAPRALSPYPSNSPTARFDTTTIFSGTVTFAQQYQYATQDRQILARQIYDRLLAVTGVPPVQQANLGVPLDADLRSRRWLAQLAVNIVDYIDDDDISTPFNFYSAQDATDPVSGKVAANYDPTTLVSNNQGEENPRYWVFGTELPRLVVNEVYTEFTSIAQPKAGNTYTNKVYVELYNPMEARPNPNPNLNTSDRANLPLFQAAVAANLQAGNIPANPNAFATYQVVVADSKQTGGLRVPTQENNNVLGSPNNIRTQTNDADFTTVGAIRQINGAGSTTLTATVAPQAFLLVGATTPDFNKTIGPTGTGNGLVPGATHILNTPRMEYTTTYNNTPGGLVPQPDDRGLGVTVLLRRLANPHIPFNNQVGSPWYNPYVTIDYIEHVQTWDTRTATTPYFSVGKKQPYAAHFTSANPNTTPTTPAATSLVVYQQVIGQATPVQHTFGAQNNPVPSSGHYDWLPHIDRVLVSPVELLHVSQYQPHHLTQQFMLADPDTTANQVNRYQHAPVRTWHDETRRLYRLLEMLEIKDRASGTTDAGHTAGKININAIWDYEVFLALCDPQNGNDFTVADVQAVWANIQARRSPNKRTFSINGVNTAVNVPGPTNVDPATIQLNANGSGNPYVIDRPFMGLATGAYAANTNAYSQFPQAQGINDTLLRATTAAGGVNAQRMFDIPPASMQTLGTDNPYVKTQLLNKIYNNVTTRSNVFAVWVTVGFFEVTDDTTRPVTLGAEMNASEGKAVRHRFFAVIDRSVMPNNPYPSVPTNGIDLLSSQFPFRPSAPPTTPFDMRGLVAHWAIID